MLASTLYGALLGIAFVVFTQIAPQPTGSIALWALLAAQLTWGAVICWRRTGLPLATTAMALGGVLSASLALLAATGRVFPDLSRELWVPVGISMFCVPLLLLAESRVNRAKWKQWAGYMERKNVWDIVTARHIPPLREKVQPPNKTR